MAPTRVALRDLADRLAVEYVDAVPPGQVLALVFRTARRLCAAPSLAPGAHLAACEEAVRRVLIERTAGHQDRAQHIA